MKSLFFLMSTLMCCSMYADHPSSKNTDRSSSTSPSGCNFDQAQFDRGDDKLMSCPSAYNLPAQVHLNDRTYQGFVTTSYLYWDAQQEGMDVATTAIWNGSSITKSGINSRVIEVDSGYNSGFKVGLGYNFENCDNWTLRADYTRLHQMDRSSHSAPSTTTGTGALYLTNWFYQTSANQNPACQHLSSAWHLGLDWLDLSISRAMYQGKKFTATPFGGIRASWISESLTLNISQIVNNFASPRSEVHSHNHSSSWGIGPRMGMEGRFLLGMGFRLQGSIGASLLFTQFTKVSHSEDSVSNGGSDISYKMTDHNCLRPMLESNLGIGWGSYFSRNRYHFDLSATYDFNYLWEQNMMRVLNEINTIGSSGNGLDLSLQGLTVSADFYF